ncbi:hypothetical protein SUGI_0687480 [Cryptomeria japonica]|nr:hypothetical protein SUGI_0687480 [Cryptomeria japonica]
MLHSQAKIIPVFYEEPWELRHIEKGVYANASTHYRTKSRYLDKLKEWEEALQSVSFTVGYELHNSVLIDCESIVSVVQKEVQRTKSFHVAKYPVGFDKLLDDFETSCLDELVKDLEIQYRMHEEGKGEANIVAIFGMGGLGKTTLSKGYQKRTRYSRSCFLYDVREAYLKGELPSLQIKFLRDHDNPPNFHSTREGTSYMKHCIERCSLLSFLIVLDDIDHVE